MHNNERQCFEYIKPESNWKPGEREEIMEMQEV